MKVNDIKITPKWKESKEDIWNKSFMNLEDNHKSDKKSKHIKRFLLYVAASVIVFINFSYIYRTSIYTPRGEQSTITLPDGSFAKLREESSLSYKPFWWIFNKTVSFSGEAFFYGKHAKGFKIESNLATTYVLGTSFNIIDRDNMFEIGCLEGKVKVKSEFQAKELTKGMLTRIKDNKIVSKKNENTRTMALWTKDILAFKNTPLRDVIETISRSYNIQIKPPSNINYYYTGQIQRMNNPQDVLNIINKTFGIEMQIIE
ncbi:MAG: FecR family protein [Marinifilaceae bacterium]|jgi:ferric-dicitrate binding protein FerR (iron transport regulator)|nr:FecR family protein [Marinifilaceae bacterium]